MARFTNTPLKVPRKRDPQPRTLDYLFEKPTLPGQLTLIVDQQNYIEWKPVKKK